MSRTKPKLHSRSHTFHVSNGTYSNSTAKVPNLNRFDLKPSTVSLKDSVVYGDNISNWKALLSDGKGVTTTLEARKQTFRPTPGWWSYRLNGGDYNFMSFQGSGLGYLGLAQYSQPQASTTISAPAEQLAASQFLKHYIKATNTWRGGNFLAEIAETYEMLRHPVESMYSHTWKFAGRVKKLGAVYERSPTSAAKLLSDLWLAFSFGILPFVEDANDATKALNELSMSRRRDTRYVKAIAGVTTTIQDTDAILPVTPLNFVSSRNRTEETASVKYKAAIHSQPSGMGNLLQEFGVGIFDVIPAVWEAIPWSFFIDYFVNVGEMLDSMRLIQCHPEWLIRTVKNVRTTTVTPYLAPSRAGINPSAIPSSSFNLYGGSVIGTSSWVRRDPLDDVPYPSWNFHLPGTKLPRMGNIVALFGQIYDSRWKRK